MMHEQRPDGDPDRIERSGAGRAALTHQAFRAWFPLPALGISAALSTGDPAVQSATLLNIFAGIRTIIIEPTTKGLILNLMLSKFDPVTGSFEATGFFRPQNGVGLSSCGTNLPSIRGQLTGLVVQFADPGCTGSLTFRDKRFVGTIDGAGQPSYEGTFAVQ
jgi:hypothetical protein